MDTSTRLKVAAVFVFVMPIASFVPGAPGTALLLSLVTLAWAVATNTRVEPALVVLFFFLLPTRAHYDGAALLAEGLTWAFAATVALSVCRRRVSPRRFFGFARRSVAQVSSRLFAPPGVRGTIHAHWFVLGFWLAFVMILIASEPDRARDTSLIMCAVCTFVMWTIRWFSPRWDPASLARVSLFVCAHPLLYLDASESFFVAFVSVLLPIAMLVVACGWAFGDARTEWGLRSGRHPRWVMAEHKGERIILRERVRDEGYRSAIQGPIVGSLPVSRGPDNGAIGSVCIFVLFHLLKGLHWLTQH